MLYRKYRPQTFSEVFGQEHVTKTLLGGLTSGRVGHAYLFCGPRGTGKTTIARIFAKALNCQKKQKNGDACDACQNCQAVNTGQFLDLIEVDAASNRGIDEIRNLKESASVSSALGGYKVFIVDEVHMLTAHAFNALLKILEEPPAHIIFILATTEPHKVLPTVLSRVQRFDLKRLKISEIVEKLKDIAKKEKINVDPDGLVAIAAASDGALRDAEVALSKVMAWTEGGVKISADDVNSILGLISYKYYPEFLSLLINNNGAEGVAFIQRLTSSGIDIDNFTRGFIDYTRKVLMHKINPAVLVSSGDELTDHDSQIIATLGQALEGQKLSRIIVTLINAREGIKSSPFPQLPIELAVLELTAV
jgi:DNA polymerase III subunit gamma/tau